MIKIIFFGTPEYTLPILSLLDKTFKAKGESPIIAVVTQKPKVTGRKKELTYSPIDTWAHKRRISKYYDAEDLIKHKVKADIGVLAAYGEIIPEKVINYIPYGILNVHPSLLPRFRGASPVQATIIVGDKTTGVSIIKMDEKLDHGPIISQFKENILPNDTSKSLRERLFEKSAEVLTTLIPAYIKGKITPRVQGESSITYTRQIEKDDAFIPPKYLNSILQGSTFKGEWKIPFIKNFSLLPSAYSLDCFIRAMQPWPVAWTYVQLNVKRNTKDAKRLKILKAHIEKLMPNDYCLVPDLVQLEGKNLVSWEQFKSGYPEASFEIQKTSL